MAKTSPYLVNGLTRHVKPYIYEFRTFAKGRWIGKQLLDVLVTEFGGFDAFYWKNAIKDLKILVNNSPTTETYLVRNSDELIHRTHRHEPPVFGQITLIGETNELIAVCKPASMPMHPCGGYKYNTLLSILAEEPLVPNQPQLFSVHRLDRVTSGLVILAKSTKFANDISKEIRSNQTEKVYLARVKGRFPANLNNLSLLTIDQLLLPTESEEVKKEIRKSKNQESIHSRKRSRHEQSSVANVEPEPSSKLLCVESSCSAPSPDDSKIESNDNEAEADADDAEKEEKEEKKEREQISEQTSLTAVDYCGYGYSSVTGELLVRYPITVVSHREGTHKCDVSGKQSLSGFRLLGYRSEDDTSLIECRPHTGRTHQLRLHLQLVGNPIANDPCYGGVLFYGQTKRREEAAVIAEKLIQLKEKSGGRLVSNMPHLSSLVRDSQLSSTPSSSTPSAVETEPEEAGHCSNNHQPLLGRNESSARIEGETEESYLIRNCRYCQQRDHGGVSAEEEAIVHCDSIWLHAIRYQGSNWMFETPPPDWGRQEDFSVLN